LRIFYFDMRNLGDGMPLSLAGSLLVAHPNMLDPNFRRTVLFIYEHDSIDGAGGVIINRPLDKQVVDLVGEAPPEGLADVPVLLACRNFGLRLCGVWDRGTRCWPPRQMIHR